MTKNEDESTTHKGLYSALAAAQGEMGKALKDTNNPHFKSKYADLASVCDACMPALSKHGIAVLQPAFDDDTGRYVKTILVHGESGETAECRVPLIVAKNDMQGYGSAVTYARRYGLMGMAGIAPEDDDGNAAAKSPPKDEPRQERKPAPQENAPTNDSKRDWFKSTMAKADSRDKLRDWWTGEKIAAGVAVLPEHMRDELATEYNRLFDQFTLADTADQIANHDLGGDGIPEFGGAK